MHCRCVSFMTTSCFVLCFHSFVAVIRQGSCDSLHNFLILSSLHYTFMKQHMKSGALLGLSVYLRCGCLQVVSCSFLHIVLARIYPVIFVPAMVLHILKPEYAHKLDSHFPLNAISINNKRKRIRMFPWSLSRYLNFDPRILSIEYSTASLANAVR